MPFVWCVTKLRLALAALPLLAACAGGVGVESDPPSSDSAVLSAPEACGAVLSPDPELLEETVDAAARWSGATGCDIRVGDGGTRVRLLAEVWEGGVRFQGLVHQIESGEVVIDVCPERLPAVLPHEIGHLLYPHPQRHIAQEPGAASCEALMCNGTGGESITAADLAFVCEGLACKAFEPEVTE